jgi:O-antigen/teichoic acid export membrane protein
MKENQSIIKRSIDSVTWNVGVNFVQIILGFLRTLLLARWLPVSVFGIYGFASSLVDLTGMFAKFGMADAFRHRAPETANEEHTAAVHFTLKLIFTLVWGTLMFIGSLLFAEGQTRALLLALIVIEGGIHLTQTPIIILTRRVQHHRLALVGLYNSIFSTAIVLFLASKGMTLWALLFNNIVTLVVNVALLYVWKPVWQPRIAWDSSVVDYFLRFGSQNFVAITLWKALDRVDDLWAGFYLGDIALGFYSRAYAFASYPRQILASPINTVVAGTYAELAHDRRLLSRAFFFINALLIRSGFFVASLIALLAPYFIRLFLGEKWLPMLDAFRLMLVYTLFDPLKMTLGYLFVAMGNPIQVVRVRSIQLMVLVVALYLLGPSLGIAGVALAVNLMLIVGIVILLWQSREYVDISFVKLFSPPGIALCLGLLLVYGLNNILGVTLSEWRVILMQALAFSFVYGIVLLVLEGRWLFEAFLMLRTNFFVKNKKGMEN